MSEFCNLYMQDLEKASLDYKMAICWFLLVEKKDLVSNIEGCCSRVDEIEEEMGDCPVYEFRTTIKAAQEILLRRLASASPYFKELFVEIEPLIGALAIRPPDGTVEIDCSSMMLLFEDEDRTKVAKDWAEYPLMLEEAVREGDVKTVAGILHETGFGGIDLSGDVKEDIAFPMDNYDMSMQMTLIGGPWFEEDYSKKK